MSGSVNKVILVAMYERDQLSIPQIAKRINWPRSRVRNRLIQCGVELRSRSDGVRLRSDVLGKHCLGKVRVFTTAHREAIKAARIAHGERHASGVSLKPNGYVEFTRGPNKGRSVHRVVMEERIGRKLRPAECVHHVNHDRSDNRIQNLQLMSRSEHTALHRALQLEEAQCLAV